MIKVLMLLVCSFVSSIVYAGGSLGGGGFGLKEEIALSLMDATVNALPKVYVGGDDFRRVNARLSVDGTDSMPVLVGDEIIQVRKLKNSIVDTKISKEILQEGGAVGGNPVAP